MKCNIRELALFSDRPCVIEGRLNYKKAYHSGYRQHSVFKERWFRLINNYLFYFKISEMGKFDTKQPAGVFVMENISVQMERGQSIPFSFSMSFIDEPDKKHIFAARSEDNVVQWVIKLRESSYEYLRCRLHTLQSRIYCITGKDPLLMVPRNDGACLWAPSEPFSSAPACSVNGAGGSFSCHLHTAGFTLERSKSDVQAQRRTVNVRPAKFYTDDAVKPNQNKPVNFELERSRTTVLPRLGPRSAIFDNDALRAAPSPPARRKPAPPPPPPADLQAFTAHGRRRGAGGILDAAPVKPSRKPSPKHTPSIRVDVSNDTDTHSQDDLIKF